MRIPFQNKFRFLRGPLRTWLILAGLLLVQFDLRRTLTGVAMIVLGAMLHFICKCHLRQNKELTLSGPYRFTRNPFYLANLIIEGGLLVMIGNPWLAAAFLAAWFVIYGRTIRSEEAHLQELFGEKFTAYCQRVPRLFPIPGRSLASNEAPSAGFSLRNRNISEGREIQRTLRILSYPLLLLAAAGLHEHGLRAIFDWDRELLLFALGFVALNCAGMIITLLLRQRASSQARPIGS